MPGCNFRYAEMQGNRLVVLKGQRRNRSGPEVAYVRSKSSAYASGYKLCSVCELFVKIDGRNCPECGLLMRCKPRFSRDRSKGKHYY